MTNINKLLEELRDGYFKGFILALNFNKSRLRELSELILNNSDIHKEIVWLTARENESLFQMIRNKHQLQVNNNQYRFISLGLKIPQDKPIILVVENFDRLNTPNDQYNISKILSKNENESLKTNINSKSIVILSGKKESNYDIKQGISPWTIVE